MSPGEVFGTPKNRIWDEQGTRLRRFFLRVPSSSVFVPVHCDAFLSIPDPFSSTAIFARSPRMCPPWGDSQPLRHIRRRSVLSAKQEHAFCVSDLLSNNASCLL
ncbi:MAG: uncharacterized protein A8A55_2970 [Amphiamblys sp. WSBS2006]|nr:MAG: uncharacterized protein A8A55_2970 [Amphiamblys sp. WSBS2006]